MKSYRLPYPVSTNVYWRTAVRGRIAVTYLSDKAKAYRTAVKAIVNDVEPIDGDIQMTIRLAPKLTKKGQASKVCVDLDNGLKVAVDALNGIAYHDDKQIKRYDLAYCAPEPNGALYIAYGPYKPHSIDEKEALE